MKIPKRNILLISFFGVGFLVIVFLFISVILISVSGYFIFSKKDTINKFLSNSPSKSATEQYKEIVNMDVPPEISGLQLIDNQGIFVNKYFTYNAKKEYVDRLINHKTFKDNSKLNSSFAKVSCSSSQFEEGFKYWTKDEIKLDKAICLEGSYYPYAQYIVYYPDKELAYHFVTEYRD